jgi:hypothetical protein
MQTIWTVNPPLARSARWTLERPGTPAHATLEVALLVGLGILAALATSLGGNMLRVPGHAILRGTLPLVLGLAPRRTAGSVMSVSAALTFAAMAALGFRLPQAAAAVGLLCLGPALDLALGSATSGWKLYVRFAAGGLAANLVAFAVRIGTGLAGAEATGSRGVLSFWPTALLGFALCGLLAGLISGALWFRSGSAGKDADPS